MADGAHAFGAQWHGKMCGEIADFTNFSFHAVKNMTTAEGGAAVHRSHDGIDEEEMYKQYMLLSLHGQTKDAYQKNKVASWEYDVVDTQYKCNMTDVLAAIGVAQLERYNKILDRRHQLIKLYNEEFKDLPVQVLNHCDENHRSLPQMIWITARRRTIRRSQSTAPSCNRGRTSRTARRSRCRAARRSRC